MSKQKQQLGKGLKALLTNIDAEIEQNRQAVVSELAHSVAMLPISAIHANKNQPRTEFDDALLNELASSIKVHGVIQPVTVRRTGQESYELISGERRWRASQMAGLQDIPAYIRIADDQEMLEMALVENIQRADLNAMEIANTYQRLIEECQLTHENLSERVGKERSTVTNYLRLLKLPPDIQQALKTKIITMGHARALSGIDDIALQLSVFRQIINQQLSVRATEDLIRNAQGKAKKADKEKAMPDAYRSVEGNLRQYLGTRVNLKLGSNGKGQIVIPFSDDDELNRLLDLIEKS